MKPKLVPLAGVIGDPISHSLSPRMHGHWLRRYAIKGHYVPLHISDADFPQALKMLPKMGFVGVNVTLPHKVAGEDGSIYADNTDGYGFIENLRAGAPNWDPKSGPAAVLGAGGAARAVILSLVDAGVTEIYLTNRTKTKSEALRSEFGPKIKVVDWVQAGNMLEECTTVVNTTSLGMTGQAELRVPLDGLRPGTTVTDLVYTPLKTKFLADAEALGCTVVDGLGMLLHQGVPGFERWFGKRPEVDETLREIMLR